MYTCVYVCMYIYIYMYRCIHMYISLSIYIYMYMYVCMCIYIYIYIYVQHSLRTRMHARVRSPRVWKKIKTLHPIPITIFRYFRTQPVDSLSAAVKLPIKKRYLGNPTLGTKSCEGTYCDGNWVYDHL